MYFVDSISCFVLIFVCFQRGEEMPRMETIKLPNDVQPGYLVTSLGTTSQFLEVTQIIGSPNCCRISRNSSLKLFDINYRGQIITRELFEDKIGCLISLKMTSLERSTEKVIKVEVVRGSDVLRFAKHHFDGLIMENSPPFTVVSGLEELYASRGCELQISNRSSQTDLSDDKYCPGHLANETSPMWYSIVEGPTHVFELFQPDKQHSRAIIRSLKKLDREQESQYMLTVAVSSVGSEEPNVLATSQVWISVLDVNDNHPIIEQDRYLIHLDQDRKAGDLLTQVKAYDLDVGDALRYKFVFDHAKKFLKLNETSGELHLSMDATDLPWQKYETLVFALDRSKKRSKAASVEIFKVSPPYAPQKLRVRKTKHSATNHFKEGRKHGATRGRRSPFIRPLRVVDIPESVTAEILSLDKGYFETFSFKESDGDSNIWNPHDLFELDSLSGILGLRPTEKLDYESRRIIDLIIIITRFDDPTFLEEQPIQIRLTDVNDETPEFLNVPRPFLTTVHTNAPPGTSVYQLVAQDADEGSLVRYLLESGGEERFEVDPDAGVVRTRGSQPFPSGKEFEIGVSCQDVTSPTTQKSSTHSLKILVGEREPQFYETQYVASFPESAQVMFKIIEIRALSHQGFPITYELSTESGAQSFEFAIDQSTGVVDLLRALDYEKDPQQYHLRVKAIENGRPARTSLVNLIVNLVDMNDNVPTFPLSQYIVQGIAETVAVGTDIIQVTATDLDSVTNSQLTYTVSDRSFTVQTLNNIGYVKTARRLDYDRIADHTYNFTIVATDNGTPPLRGSAAVRVSVTNVNDEDPVFVQPLEKVMVSEDAPPSTVVHVVQAYDPDGDDVTYTFSGGRLLEGPFSIDMKSGIITLVGPLDKTKVSYHLNVTAVDNGRCCGGTTTRKSQGQVIIEVKDINNNAPRFPDCSSYNPVVMEKENVGTFVIQVKAVDPDTGSNGNVTYSLIKSNDLSNDKFEIEPRTGIIRTSDVFDREAQLGVTDFGVTVKAEDQGTQTLAGFCTFRVKIGDKNDNPPVFNLPHYATSIEERCSVGKRIKQVYATDRDAGDNGKVEYFLSNDSSGFFSVNQYNGWVTVARPMSGRELVTIEIEARDKGIPSRSGFVRMDIEITQTTNAYPQWQEDYSLVPARISENAPVNTVVKRLKAFSSIPDSLVNYVIQPGEIPEQNGQPRSFYHRIDEVTNEMVLLTYRPLDYEALPQYILTIKAANRATNSLHNDTRLVIDLRDENDEIPQFVGLDENGRYPGSVAENLEPGTEVITVTATDKDQFPDFKKIYYRIKEVGADYDKFSIDRETGVIRSVSSFDREAKNEYYLTVVAEDGAPSDRPNHYPPGTPNMGEAEVQIRVTDMNDNSPFFRDNLYTTRVPENTDPGTVIITVTAEDRDEENRLTYSIVGGNTGNSFEVVADLGEIKVRGHLDYEDGPREYMLTYRVFDDKFTNTTHVRVQVLDVNDNPPIFDNNIYNVTDIMEEEPGISKNNPKYLLSVRATDPDIDRNSVVKYSLTGQFADDGTFFVNEHTGEIYLTKSLDRDHGRGRPVWNFNVLAHDEPDSHQPSLTGYAEVRVMPRDINDNAPVFDRNRLVGRILEHSRAGMTVLTVIATDADNGNNGSVGYTLKQVPMRGNQPLFSIDSHMGLISTMINNALDREVQAEYQVLVQARDKGIPPMIASATVTIIIDDINDHRPRFNHPLYRATIPEDAAVGSSVISVSASDKDVGHNAKLTYTLSEMDREHFYIMTVEATNTGVLKVFKPIDFDSLSNPVFNVTVYVQDSDPGHTDVTSVEVKVTDANDNPPVFVPNSKKVTIFENVTIGTTLHRFSASDKDTGINKQFSYSVDRHTDVDRRFSIDSNGLVTTSKLLDREIVQGHRIHILAIDRGNPPQTGTGTLMVHLNDVNDNPPEFASSYRPVVYENRPPGQTVVVISAVDRDTASNGPPFEMWLPCGGVCPCHSNPTCADFEFRFLPDGGENNFGAGLVRTLRTFDRETRKEFKIPIILKDSGHPPVSGTSTLTVVIGDINDNQHYPGHKDVLVYNYVGWKGEFETLPFGNVYAEDEDDWDVSNKTFHLLSHKYDEDLFGLERHTGHLYSKGRLRGSEYHLRVKVHDMVWKKEVTSTVTVRVKEITDDALNNLGSFRMEGITAEEFIGREKIGSSPSGYGQSKMDLFARLMSKKLGSKYHPPNVEVISLINTPSFDHVVDVRFAVHASPYLKPSKLNGILNIYREEFEELLGGRLLMSPIDECLEERQCYGNRKGCSTRVVTSDSDPLIVNTNSSSLVGIVVTSYAECICKGNDFLGEKGFECQPGSCLNGGTCVQTLSSVECLCPIGYKGPRCQQTHLSFNGDGYAWFPALDQCDESHTSFEFVTLKENGLMFFYGSLVEQRPDSNEDFMLLELRGGYPYMRINLGSGEVKLSLDGEDKQGVKRMDKLNDGKWHRIDVIISTRTLQLVVDRCENGVILQESDSDSSSTEDRRSCESVIEAPGEGRRLNVNSLLSLGGRHQDHHRSTFPPNVMKEGFDGCIKNFMHNSELYDLHVGKTGGGLNAEDFCSREDKICYNKRYEGGKRREKEQRNATLLKLASCGEEGACVTGFVSPSETYPIQMCLCNAGWRGTFCNIETTILDFGTKSFLEWDFKDDFYSYLDKRGGYKSDVKLMFRTRRNSGLLFKAQNAQKSEYILLEIHQTRLRFRFNLGHRENSLVLSRINVSDGVWHSVSVERRGRWVEMRADKGEGLHYNSTLGYPDEGRVEIKLSQRSILSGGDVRFPSSDSPPLVDHDFEDGCMNDIRFNEAWLPMSVLENHESEAAEFMVRSQNVVTGCPSDACDHSNCGLLLVCVDLWRRVECRCPVGSRPVNLEVMHPLIFNPSHEQLTCEPINECLEANPCHFGECQDTPEGFYCLCSSGYSGLYCAEIGSSLSSSVTMAPEGLLAIVVSLVVIAVLIIVIIIASRKRPDDSYTNGVDPHDDVRENIIHYDEEGIGEEDQLKYDINKLKKPVSCGKKVLNGLKVAPVDVRARKIKNIKQTKLNNKSPVTLPLSSPNNAAKAIKQKLWQVDHDTTAPPYDTVREYAFEGSGSFAGSLSSLASNCEEEFDPSESHGYRDQLDLTRQEWSRLSCQRPGFKKLADLYGFELRKP